MRAINIVDARINKYTLKLMFCKEFFNDRPDYSYESVPGTLVIKAEPLEFMRAIDTVNARIWG